MYRTVLFDFDGTLVPSLDFWLDAFKVALKAHDLDVPEETIIDRCFYRDDTEIVKNFDLKCAKTFWGLVGDHLRERYSAPVMFPGAKEVLDHCRDNKIPLGLVTSAEKEFVVKALDQLNIRRHFSSIVTANDITKFKPHPEPVLKALGQLSAEAQSTLFVGDYVVDVAAGKAAGTHTALYFNDSHRRFHKFDHVSATQPTHIFSDYNELLSLLKAVPVDA